MEPGYEVFEYTRRGNLREVREALRSGVGPDQYMSYDGATALIMAARGGHHDIVKELLAHKASVDVRTDDGSTVLSHAISGKSVPILQCILEAGVPVDEPNEDGMTPLMLAAHYGLADMVQALCSAGADINRCVDGWGTPLDSAQDDAIAMLEKLGGRRSGLTGSFEEQPLAAAAERFTYGCFESGENPNKTPTAAPTAPCKATEGVHVKLIRPKAGLLKHGDIGVVVEDDGSDCLPLKVKFGDSHDYYNHSDLEVCEAAVELPPDSDRATAEGTSRYTHGKKLKAKTLGSTGLAISPVGFGCHRLYDNERHKAALSLAIQLGCNLLDLAPNYADGESETVVGVQLQELLAAKKVRRDELVVMTKVGNIVSKQMKFVEGVPDVVHVSDTFFHCMSPEWIEQELTRSLERLQLTCVDCVMLHNPEQQCQAGVDMSQVYTRLKAAFEHLEKEVERGRIAMYGVSGAFFPLRPTEPEHLELATLLQQLPKDHHFRVLQFPLNFAETQVLTVGHTARGPDGVAIDRELGVSSPTLFEMAREHGLATLANRPLNGIYKESHGVLRFSSLDCEERSFSEMQLDNCDTLEEKLNTLCKLEDEPYGVGGVGNLAAKSVKVLSSLKEVDCVLLGMRQPEYVVGTLSLAFSTPPLAHDVAMNAVRALHNTVTMWFATAIHEADHGTAKDWRLPINPKYEAEIQEGLSKCIGA